MWVIDGSSVSFAWMVCCTAGRSAPLTCRFSVCANVFFTPAQRVSSATEPWAWMMQSVFLPPSPVIFVPMV